MASIDISITVGAAQAALCTLPLQNPGGVALPMVQPTRTIGWVFKDGDIPPGAAPTLSTPFSAGLQTYWPSGCLRKTTLMLMGPAISAGTTESVSIGSGGAWPAASGRTLAEVYAAGFRVNAPLFPSPSNGRNGQVFLGAWLNGDANTIKVRQWLDGEAGAGWCITTHMAEVESGPIDGMLTVDHYIIALNDIAGNLGGFRYKPVICQPFYNQTGKANNAPGTYVFFAPNLSWSGAGVTKPVQWIGADGNPLGAVNFTVTPPSGGSTANVVGANNWYVGAGGGQFMPVFFSGLPSGSQGSSNGANVENGGWAWAYTDTNAQTSQVQLYAWPQQNNSTQFHFGAPFSGTMTPCPAVAPFGRLIVVSNPDGDYDFAQGAGSLTSDSVLHPQIDRDYWRASGVIPPWDTSTKGTALGGPIVEQDFNYPWFPYSGPLQVQEPGTGDHPDIGLLPAWAPIDFDNMTPGMLRCTRIIGQSAATVVANFRDAATGTRLNLGDPSKSYGLATPSSQAINWHNAFVGNGGGFAVPSTCALGPYALSVTEHLPAFVPWWLLREGDLFAQDLLTDMADLVLLGPGANRTATTANAGISTTLYGVVGGPQSNELRAIAWAWRDMHWLAMLYSFDPTGNPANPVFDDGTMAGQYALDVSEACAQYPLLQFQSPLVPSNSWGQANGVWYPWTATKIVTFGGVSSGAFGNAGGQWELMDLYSSVCLAAMRGSAAAKQFLQTCAAPRLSMIMRTVGGWLGWSDANVGDLLVPSDQTGQWADTLAASDSQVTMSNFPQFTYIAAGHNWITWAPNSPTQPAFRIAKALVANDHNWTPTDGDIIVLAIGGSGDTTPPELASNAVPYSLTNVQLINGLWWFDVAPLGSMEAIPITSTCPTGMQLGWRLQPAAGNKPPLGVVYAYAYLGNGWLACCTMSQVGITGLNAAISDLQARMAINDGNPGAGGGGIDPSGWFFQRKPSGSDPGFADPRYCASLPA